MSTFSTSSGIVFVSQVEQYLTYFPLGGFSFNKPATSTPAAATTTPAFSFGAPANNAAAANSSTSTAAAPSFSFGNLASTSNNNTAAASTSTAAASKPLFGGFSFSNAANANAAPSQPAPANPFSFGASTSTANTSTQPAGQLFQPAPLLGGQQQQQPLNLFASAVKPNPLTVSQLLGSTATSSTNAFGSGNSNNPAGGLGSSSFVRPPQPELSLEERISNVQNAWNPQSPSNRFAYYFYNLSPAPLQVPLTQLPVPANVVASAHLAALYKAAVLESPRPAEFVPALATGMDDLKKRVDAQQSMASLHLSKLRSAELQGKITERSRAHWQDTLVRLDRAHREQVRLEEKLIHICARLAGLPSSTTSAQNASTLSMSGSSNTVREDQITLAMLERIRDQLSGTGRQAQSQVNTPAGARLAGIVNEMWMIISQRKAMLSQRSSGSSDAGSSAAADWAIADEGELNRVLEVSARQLVPELHVKLTFVACAGPQPAATIPRLSELDTAGSDCRSRYMSTGLRSSSACCKCRSRHRQGCHVVGLVIIGVR